MNSNSQGDAQRDGTPARRPVSERDDRPWWQRSWGAVLMLAGAALLMGLALTLWSEAAPFGG
ncbi:hypothetical protein [Ancylobacter oerskovii]|uniref:Uncharacterized protein n=1 Tax=Ancylobacter oerskovii TaxID=459519 RepID=A0ABW4YXS4_9HYPH|nr:hypothetical protein [Ancylobacter oerskovii]MBS7541940.1 hypothetical protein [Ancylobacter oerskovii]